MDSLEYVATLCRQLESQVNQFAIEMGQIRKLCNEVKALQDKLKPEVNARQMACIAREEVQACQGRMDKFEQGYGSSPDFEGRLQRLSEIVKKHRSETQTEEIELEGRIKQLEQRMSEAESDLGPVDSKR